MTKGKLRCSQQKRQNIKRHDWKHLKEQSVRYGQNFGFKHNKNEQKGVDVMSKVTMFGVAEMSTEVSMLTS